jgi:Flp pilus assembly protein TadG
MLRHRSSPRRGQSLVEFALIAPLLFAMLFILVELGIVFSIYIGLTNSAREAARAGSVYQYPNPETLTTDTMTSAAAQQLVDTAREAYIDQAIELTRNPIIDVTSASQLYDGDPYTYDPNTVSNIQRFGDKITVRLAYNHNLFFNLFGARTLRIRASSEMRLEPGGN